MLASFTGKHHDTDGSKAFFALRLWKALWPVFFFCFRTEPVFGSFFPVYGHFLLAGGRIWPYATRSSPLLF